MNVGSSTEELALFEGWLTEQGCLFPALSLTEVGALGLGALAKRTIEVSVLISRFS